MISHRVYIHLPKHIPIGDVIAIDSADPAIGF
jgi:hypothetical protein